MAPTPFEEPYYVYPTAKHTHTIIALHGRGSQGQEFAGDLFESKLSSGQSLKDTFSSCKWVFPSSQERYSTVSQEELDEWFDIYSLTDPAAREELQIEGLHDSVEFLQGVLRKEIEIVGSDNVILLGLSQGCATGLSTFLASNVKLGAYIGLNGWMPLKAQVENCSGRREDLTAMYETSLGLKPILDTMEEHSTMLRTPIFLAHNTDDEVIDVNLGRQARDVLESLGFKVVWHEEKEGGHLGMLGTNGLDSIVHFLGEVMGHGLHLNV